MSDKKKTTVLDLSSPAFNYEAAADALNTMQSQPYVSRDVMTGEYSFVHHVPKEEQESRREKVHKALQRIGLGTAGLSIASPLTAFITEGVGATADLVDGILYSLEGKHGESALSYASILPFVGGTIAAKRVAQEAIDSGDDFLYAYRGIADISEEGAPELVKRSHRVVDIDGVPTHVGGNMAPEVGTRELLRWYGEVPFQKINSPGFAHVFGIDNSKQVLHASEIYTTTSPLTSIHYAMNQGLHGSREGIEQLSKMFGNQTGTVIRYKIPMSHIKEMANTPMVGFDTASDIVRKSGQKSLHSNDYFLKRLHGIGTGRALPPDMVSGYSQDMARFGGNISTDFRNVDEFNLPGSKFSKIIEPGGTNVVRFDAGIPDAYVDKVWAHKTFKELSSVEELMQTSFQNKSIQRMLKNRNIPTDNVYKVKSLIDKGGK